MPPPSSEAVNRDETVTGPDYLLQPDSDPVVDVQPGLSRAKHPFVAAIGLAMIRQNALFEGDVGIEKGEFCLTEALGLAEGSKSFDVLPRHRPAQYLAHGDGTLPEVRLPERSCVPSRRSLPEPTAAGPTALPSGIDASTLGR